MGLFLLAGPLITIGLPARTPRRKADDLSSNNPPRSEAAHLSPQGGSVPFTGRQTPLRESCTSAEASSAMMEPMGEMADAAGLVGEERRPPAGTALAIAGVLLGTLLQSIDGSVVNVAVPQIQAQLGGPLALVGWVVTGYAVASLIAMPLCSGLAARVGMRAF